MLLFRWGVHPQCWGGGGTPGLFIHPFLKNNDSILAREFRRHFTNDGDPDEEFDEDEVQCNIDDDDNNKKVTGKRSRETTSKKAPVAKKKQTAAQKQPVSQKQPAKKQPAAKNPAAKKQPAKKKKIKGCSADDCTLPATIAMHECKCLECL